MQLILVSMPVLSLSFQQAEQALVQRSPVLVCVKMRLVMARVSEMGVFIFFFWFCFAVMCCEKVCVCVSHCIYTVKTEGMVNTHGGIDIYIDES